MPSLRIEVSRDCESGSSEDMGHLSILLMARKVGLLAKRGRMLLNSWICWEIEYPHSPDKSMK